MTVSAAAKLNLFLDITGKRADGYHELETVMLRVDLCDYITVEKSEKNEEISISCSDPDIPTDERNTCHKAARLFFEKTGIVGGANIRIDKRIPHGAGLGGGSADAAAALAGLNFIYEKPISEENLLKIAAKTGADVPFCLSGHKAALCGGIGEKITPISVKNDYFYLIVKPDFSCGTKEAYELYDKAEIPRRRFDIENAEFYNVFRVLYNDERINSIIKKLKKLGAVGAELTGSGSAVFGAFETFESAINAAEGFGEYFTCAARASGGLRISS